jgi:hypothetical protein
VKIKNNKPLSKYGKIEMVAKYLVSQFWLGAEVGTGNSSTRNMNEEAYYELTKKDWISKAEALLDAINKKQAELKKPRKKKRKRDCKAPRCKGKISHYGQNAVIASRARVKVYPCIACGQMHYGDGSICDGKEVEFG